ncbi:UNVERIFIED_CONTAM: hypothetical protein NCL1_19779 [Trichonephila clavipes]
MNYQLDRGIPSVLGCHLYSLLRPLYRRSTRIFEIESLEVVIMDELKISKIFSPRRKLLEDVSSYLKYPNKNSKSSKRRAACLHSQSKELAKG